MSNWSIWDIVIRLGWLVLGATIAIAITTAWRDAWRSHRARRKLREK